MCDVSVPAVRREHSQGAERAATTPRSAPCGMIHTRSSAPASILPRAGLFRRARCGRRSSPVITRELVAALPGRRGLRHRGWTPTIGALGPSTSPGAPVQRTARRPPGPAGGAVLREGPSPERPLTLSPVCRPAILTPARVSSSAPGARERLPQAFPRCPARARRPQADDLDVDSLAATEARPTEPPKAASPRPV